VKNLTRRTVLFLLFGLTAPGRAAELETLRTDDLLLIYRDPLQAFLAPYAARCFENSIEFQKAVLGWEPSSPVTVLLNDYSDAGNASALGVPRNLLLLETSPVGVNFETVTTNERLNWLFNHELVHIAAVDRAAERDRFFRKAFLGKVAPTSEQPATILWFYLTSPRDAAPRWYHEGIAVFAETWMAGGVGRAQGAWDEMVFRAMVRDGARFYDPLGLVSEGTRTDFQVEVNSYLYGTRFLTWLAYTWSPSHLVRWIAREDGSKAYYSSRFEEVFGKPLDAAWAEWIAWEKEFQARNLGAIRTYPVTEARDLSARALGSVSRAAFDAERRRFYAAFHYPGQVSSIGSISLDDGSVERILEVKDPVLFTVTSLAWDPLRRRIFYTADNREYRDLREVDPETGESRTLLKDARIGDLAFDRATGDLWGIRHFNAIASLVRIPPPYDGWNLVRSWPYGEVPRDLDVSPDGRSLSVAVGGIDGRHVLRVHRTEDLLRGDASPVAETSFGEAAPLNFVFSGDGRFLYGTTTYTGVPNVFRWEWEANRTEAVTNAESGFFRPLPLPDGDLLVFRYTGEGFVPALIRPEPVEDVEPIEFLGARLIAKFPELAGWNVGSPAEIPLEERTRGTGPYRSGRSIRVESLYPILEGYKDSTAAGLRLNLSDPLLLNRLALAASYSPDGDLSSDERLHLDLRYNRYDWRAHATWNDADFYDLFGPTKTGRKGYSFGGGWGRTLLYDRPRSVRLDLDAAYYGDLEILPDYQNIASPVSRLLSLEGRLEYANVRSSLGHVDEEKGHRVEALALVDRAPGATFPKLLGTYDQGFPLPLDHSSVWFRTAAGVGSGDRGDPLSNFYFGGFGNNWVDHGNEKRYREPWSFPGLEINEIGGKTFGKFLLEWNLPPLRFRRLGSPGFHATWLRTSLFASGIATDFDDGALRREVGNVGLQVDVRLSVLSRLEMTLSLGYASAFEKGLGPRDEVMASLKVLP
jgi:hypothetical protein